MASVWCGMSKMTAGSEGRMRVCRAPGCSLQLLVHATNPSRSLQALALTLSSESRTQAAQFPCRDPKTNFKNYFGPNGELGSVFLRRCKPV